MTKQPDIPSTFVRDRIREVCEVREGDTARESSRLAAQQQALSGQVATLCSQMLELARRLADCSSQAATLCNKTVTVQGEAFEEAVQYARLAALDDFPLPLLERVHLILPTPILGGYERDPMDTSAAAASKKYQRRQRYLAKWRSLEGSLGIEGANSNYDNDNNPVPNKFFTGVLLVKSCPRCGALRPRGHFDEDVTQEDGLTKLCYRCTEDYERVRAEVKFDEGRLSPGQGQGQGQGQDAELDLFQKLAKEQDAELERRGLLIHTTATTVRDNDNDNDNDNTVHQKEEDDDDYDYDPTL